MEDLQFVEEHFRLTRRFFLRAGVLGGVFGPFGAARGQDAPPSPAKKAKRPRRDKGGVQPDPYFTQQDDFGDVSRGTPLPHRLPEQKKRAVGLTRETWRLEILSDPDKPARIRKPLLKSNGSALDFAALLELGKTHAVRFPKLMTCLNMGCPLGMGLWEGVPLRELVWLAQPRDDIRRVFYYGYHNDDPKQIFRSSLPISRILEDPFDLPPVIACYKLNGEYLTPERGGPVRIVVPEAYGFKSIKWLTHLVLTNLFYANDTYGEQNNDVDSPLKTFAASLSVPHEVEAGKPIPVSGYAQVGVSGLSKVQVSMESNAAPRPDKDPYFVKAPWVDAQLLGVPRHWGSVDEWKIPPETQGFDASGVPKAWPMRLTKAHWAALLPGLPKGEYTFRSRTIDEKGYAQPLPRPFRKLGFADIESIVVVVK